MGPRIPLATELGQVNVVILRALVMRTNSVIVAQTFILVATVMMPESYAHVRNRGRGSKWGGGGGG